MSRKKEPTHVTEKNIFPTRLRKLMEDQSITQKKLADAIEMRPQTVSLYTTGQSAPDVNTLRKMAEFFHVSSDYLIGLTDVKKPDATIQAVCEYTGLSEESISLLHLLPSLHLPSDCIGNSSSSQEILFALNYLIPHDHFRYLLSTLAGIKNSVTFMPNGDDLHLPVKIGEEYRVINLVAVLRSDLTRTFEEIVDEFIAKYRRIDD